jgi:hypothetical protein
VSLDRVLGQEGRLRDRRLVIPSAAMRATRSSEAVRVVRLSVGSRRAGTGCDELLVGPHGNRVGTRGTGQLERLAELLARAT